MIIKSKLVKISSELDKLYRLLTEAWITDPKEVSLVLMNFSMKMVDGVPFKIDREISSVTLDLALAIVRIFGKDSVSIPEVREIGFKVFSSLVINEDEQGITYENFTKAFEKKLEAQIENRFSYVARCELFWFEDDISELLSEFVSVKPSQKFDSTIPWFPGHDAKVSVGRDFNMDVHDGQKIYTIPRYYWEIRCNAPKENTRREAKWMANVFISLVRLGIPPTSYCHRPTLGEVEASLGDDRNKSENGVIINDKTWHGFGLAIHSKYRVNGEFSKLFHGAEFQSKLTTIFSSPKSNLGFRLANSLGWLTRARQTDDYSERLLFNFTAIEALLSEQGAFAPVSETIARYASVILAKAVEIRFGIYKDVKRLYGFRSSLVHRGQRETHLIDSNSIQQVAETCLYLVLKNCDLSQKHAAFLNDLKEASHGSDWL